MASLKSNVDVRVCEKMLLTATEASALSGLTLDIIRLEIQKGNIDCIIVGKKKKVLIARKTLEVVVADMARRRVEISPSTARQESKELRGVNYEHITN